MTKNIIKQADSYKVPHWNLLPRDTEYIYSYFESRSGALFEETTFFGLQGLLKKYFLGIQVTQEKIEQAATLFAIHFGNDKLFNRAGWEYIVDKHGGKLPLRILAVPEGTPVTVSNVLMSVVNTDPMVPWLTNYVETLLTHIWYTSTVATLSRSVKQHYKMMLNQTADNPDGINFMLHDFGYRGVSSEESAGSGGAAHLVNFSGTDTLPAMDYALEYYSANLLSLAFSVVASEHSIMTCRGREGEAQVTREILERNTTGIVSIVGDSFNIYDFADKILGVELKQMILNRDGIVVVRPDSGNPQEVVLKLLTILEKRFGVTYNSKSYKVLNPKIRVIWGDGIDFQGIKAVLGSMMINGWSTENIVFGMGGGLLQKINRDTQRFAFKSSAQCRSGIWYDVWKDPIDSSKASKRGILALYKTDTGYSTVKVEPTTENIFGNIPNNVLVPVYENGNLLVDYTFDQVRNNAKI